MGAFLSEGHHFKGVPQLFGGRLLQTIPLGPPLLMGTQVYLKKDRKDVQVERAACLMQCPVNLLLLALYFFNFLNFNV